MADPNHPIWASIRVATMSLVLLAILWMNASNFDFTEIKTLIELFLFSIGVEAGVKALKKVGRSD